MSDDRILVSPTVAKLMQIAAEGIAARSVVVYPMWAVTPFIGGHVYEIHGLTEERARALAAKFDWVVLTKNRCADDWHSV